ncbi:hypothetical protein JZ751_009714 [Albula glossodonta]|uniref:SH3 domain-containing protein n=1 Tax=Albula glossodonta TaxID=121402 RepID=A0A8T2P1D4_9TELE|nr:hypothetical protein JZ751_009714 [Albula glossodonta]
MRLAGSGQAGCGSAGLEIGSSSPRGLLLVRAVLKALICSSCVHHCRLACTLHLEKLTLPGNPWQQEYQNFGWWVGEMKGSVGIVPKDYLMEMYVGHLDPFLRIALLE